MLNPSMAILHFTCPPVVGGVEQLIGVHAGLLADHGYPTRVVTGKGGAFRPDVPVEIVHSLYSKNVELLSINEELDRGEVSSRFIAAVERIRGELRTALSGVDVCVVHNAFTLHFNLPLTAALHWMVEEGDGPRFVAWCHDLSWTNELYRPKMRDSYPWNLLKRPLKGVDYVVVSSARRAELADLFGWRSERFQIIPAGVDVAAQLKLEPETAELVNRLGLLDANPLMLAPVRITKRKNLELAIRITHALKQRDVPARLLVTGPPGPHNVHSGDYVDQLRWLRSDLGVQREVVLLFEHTGTPEGDYPVSDRMMYDLYSLSDLLLFTSDQEGFGIPVLEAGLFKLPVFCSDIGPFREIGGDAVRYFQLTDDPASIAERIASWTRADRIHRLRRKVMDGYRWESIFGNQIEPLVAGRR